jgi:hypothetical protein
VINLAAAQAFVAAIGGRAVTDADGILAIQSLGQSSREALQIFQLVAGKKVSVTEPTPHERTLEQFDCLFLFRKIFEGHEWIKPVVPTEGVETSKLFSLIFAWMRKNIANKRHFACFAFLANCSETKIPVSIRNIFVPNCPQKLPRFYFDICS